MYVELKYSWPIEGNNISIRDFVKSLPSSVIAETLDSPGFGRPISFDLLINKYRTALLKYHSDI